MNFSTIFDTVLFYFCFWMRFCLLNVTLHICTKTQIPTHTHKQSNQNTPSYKFHINHKTPVRENYVKQPSYCRSLCSNKVLKSSSKSKHMHGRKDGFKKRKKPKIRSDRDLLLLRSYKNKNIPTGTNILCFSFFVFWFPFVVTLNYLNVLSNSKFHFR